jgi:hypothetical protein
VVVVPVPIPSAVLAPPHPPCEQLLAAVVVGAGSSCCWGRSPPALSSPWSCRRFVVPPRCRRSPHRLCCRLSVLIVGSSPPPRRQFVPPSLSSSGAPAPLPRPFVPLSHSLWSWCVVGGPRCLGWVVLVCWHRRGRHPWCGACRWSRRRWGRLVLVCCSHPRSTLRAVARRRGGVCWVVPPASWGTGAVLHRHGALSLLLSWSPLLLLLLFLPPFAVSPVPSPLLSFHIPSTPRAVAREAGGRWCVVRGGCHCHCHCRCSPSPSPSSPPPPIHPASRSSQWWFVRVCSSLLSSSFHLRSTPRAVAHEAGGGWWVGRRRRSSFAPPGVVVGPLAPPIHPASRCSQLWRGCGSWWNTVVSSGCVAAPYAVLLASAVTWRVTGVWGCVPGGYPSPGVSRHPSAPSEPMATASHPI